MKRHLSREPLGPPRTTRRRTLGALAAAGLLTATALLPGASAPAQAVALDDSDFLAANGAVLRTGHGTGEVVNLRGTNLGGWLTFEDWMSPLGEFALDRTGWSATASGGSAAAILDGDLDTRWTSGAAQTGGEWVQVDLGAPTLVNRITLDAGGSTTDRPAAYEVLVSSDGVTWASVAAAPGAAQTGVTAEITTTRFAPQVTRHVRVVQQGSAAPWWSVAELNLFSDPVLNNNGRTASASVTGGGTTAAAAIDGQVTTGWTTGTSQVAGQSYTLDLGTNTEVSKVLFDSGAAYPNDYPASYELAGSTDGSTWTKIGSGFGTNRIVTSDLWTSTWMRYLRITQTGVKANWWSISEIAVTSGSAIDRAGWSVTTAPGGATGAVTDGNLGTRWTTGAPQAPGQWVQVDLGARLTFNNVTLDTEKNTSSETDYPRAFTVAVSDDATTWRTVATGTGTVKATTVNFSATSGRYLRVTQTGTSGSWWSIGELTVALNNDDYSLRLALDERFGAAEAQDIIDTHRDTWITETDLDNIAAIGLNTIRLPIGWNELLELDGTWKADPWSRIDWLVQEAGERGIYVLLDLHTVPGGGCPWGSCGRVGPNPNGFWGSSTYQDWAVQIWSAIAARYEGNPTVAGYDLINEPLLDYGEDADDVAQKSAVYDRLYDAVRAVDPDHLVVLGAFFGWDKVAMPSTYGWTNVMYQLHPYDMPNGQDWDAQNAVVTTQLADVVGRLTNPGVPVLYGEYSWYYFDDIWARFMAGLNAVDVSWTNWAYKVRGPQDGGGGYWGFYNTNLNPVPIINSDDADSFRSRLAKFGTSAFSANTRMIATAQHYAGGLDTVNRTAISTSGWTASASVTEPGGSAAGAIDGSTGTRWATGTSQAPGQWFQVDMGSARQIGSIVLQTRSNDRWDYPRMFEVRLSTNGTTWTTVATGPGFGWKRPISFTTTTARYVRIVQTGSAPEWWSIGELTAYTTAP
ncbi:discoidin domain-containing protein [Cellulomonas soli]|uniref:discoidin domain-containing protein n=1 Tax=Cellulomonas soli TaxID=931535 RepID=UPI003F828961